MDINEQFSRFEFRLIIQKTNGNKFFPLVMSGNIKEAYPFTVPTATFIVSTNYAGVTDSYLSPIRVDDIVRFQVNHKYLIDETDIWVDVFEGRVSDISSSFNTGDNDTTINCVGHSDALAYTYLQSTATYTDQTTGYILDALMPSVTRISTDTSNIDTTNSTSISSYEIKKDSKSIGDVIRELEELEISSYIFRLAPQYDTDDNLTSVLPIWAAISDDAIDGVAVNENSKTFLSAEFKTHSNKLTNKVTIYGGGSPQVSATVENTISQNRYDVRQTVLVDKTISTSSMCANIGNAIINRWSEPVITGTVKIRGNTIIRPGDRIKCRIPSIEINGEIVNNTFLVREVTHEIGKDFVTTLKLGDVDITMSSLIESFVLGDKRNNLNGID